MPELSPTIFAVVVAVLVGAMVIVPRLKNMKKKPNAHELYFGSASTATGQQPSAEVPHGAPRATSPTRGGVPVAKSSTERPEPLRLP
jgi:hypothetical protein